MKTILLLFGILFSSIIHANGLTQTIRGTIKDQDGKYPLVGVNVIISNIEPNRGTATGTDGTFRFENVPVGRVDLMVSYIGYDNKVISNLVVGSGKEVVVNVEIQESVLNIDEVVVKARKDKGEVLNEMALISARSFSVEETKRYAGSFSDPSRMVSSYAGVASNPEGNNDIVVRGNSPKGILWRMEGVEIPNPNHFADEGSTGGPISALNSDLLANSDFYTGAFSPEYGNVLSGVFDLNLRTGNNEKREYSFGLGVLGTDLTMEGPFKEGYAGSYLVNYRYSSLDLLDRIGVVDFNGVPKYQDGAFKVLLPSKKIGTFSFFGLGGFSSIHEQNESASGEIENQGTYGANMGVVGLNHMYHFSKNTFLRTSMALSGNGSGYDWEEKDSNNVFYESGKANWDKTNVSFGVTYSNKINAKNRIVVGAKHTLNSYDLKERYYDEEQEKWVDEFNFNDNAALTQGYVSWKLRMSSDITMVSGLHAMYYDMNDEFVLEPRVGVRWKLTPKQAVNFGYGAHSKNESIITYATMLTRNDGSSYMPNINLGFSKANHYVMGYEYRITKNINSKVEFYYQNLQNIPVENLDSSFYSILNNDEGYINKDLTNDGKGKNYGMEITLERYFNNQYYFLVTSSLYESTYKSKEGIERNTKYNGNFAFNVLAGKEFKIKENNILSVNAKYFYSGGRRYIPVNLAESKQQGEHIYDYSRAWENKLDKIHQINLGLSYRINKPRASHEIIVDVMNLTNNQARLAEYYNAEMDEMEYDHQLNMIPNLMYRIHF